VFCLVFVQKSRISFFLFLSLFCFYSEAKTPQRRNNENYYSNIEQTVLAADQTDLANLMRELRLLNPYPEKSLYWSVWNEQAQFNVPILIQGSLALNKVCQKTNKTSLLFSARGCCHFIKIFEKLFPNYQSHYLPSSRHMYRHATPEYVHYFKSFYSSKTIIVDEMGSGHSCGQFFKEFFASDPSYICLVGVNKNVPCILHGSSRNLEKINFDLTGSLISYGANGPVRLAPEYKIEEIQPAHDCIDKCVHLLEQYSFDRFDKKLLKKLFAELQNYQPTLGQYFINNHKPDK